MKNGKYILVVAPPEYPGKKYRGRYCYEHLLVWWKHTNDIVSKGFVIHHKNKDATDNRFENLEKLSVKAHNEHHGKEHSVTKIGKCPNCKKEFIAKKRPVQKFCSRYCSGQFSGKKYWEVWKTNR